MPRLIALLRNRLLVSFFGIGALATLIWFGADFIRFGADNRSLGAMGKLIVILIVVAIWGLWSLVRFLLERRRNRVLLQEMQADSGVDGEDQRSREEQQQLQRRFSEALQLLRKSRFRGGSGSKALYQLPWYIIIGPPGAGKTTVLVNSGLDFPLADSHGKGALGGVGGTRNCDWWFTNDAVLIDTAGRYTTQDSHRVVDSGAWQNFLGLLKKHRRRQPINGAIVAISVQDLLMQTSEQRSQHARLIRARLDELQEQLGIRFPVYMVFTKCDLVAGFSEFFANQSSSEREQVWGITYPFDQSADQLVAEFGRDYDALLQRLGERTVWRMHQERDAGQRALIAGFSLQMGNLKKVLGEFLQQAFVANRFQDQPLLRGVYFSSGTQEGTPIDRMMAAVTANFRLGRDVGRAQRNTGKSFFIRNLLRDVIFAEANLVGTNRKVENLLRWGRRAAFAGLALLIISTLAVWTGAVVRNNQYMGQVRAEVEAFERVRPQLDMQRGDPRVLLAALDPLRSASEVYQQENHPWLSGLGLYDGSVDRAADQLYAGQLGQQLLPYLQSLLETQLNRLTASDEQLLPTLRVYLMLVEPGHRDAATIQSWAAHHWQATLPGQAGQQQALSRHLRSLLDSDFQTPQPDRQLIARARQQLRQIPVAQRVYAQLKSGDNMQPMDLYNAIGGNTELVFGAGPDDARFSVPRLFTRQGYQSVDLTPGSATLRGIAGDRWLFGDQGDEDFSEADLERIADDVRRLYLAEYIDVWQRFLDQLKIQPFDTLERAAQVVDQLADPVYSPLLGILKVVADNTHLTRMPAAVMNVAAVEDSGISQRLQPTPVDQEFRELRRLLEASEHQPAQVANLLSGLRSVHTALSDVSNAPNPDTAAFETARGRFASPGSDVWRQLNLQAANQREPIKSWLQQTTGYSWSALLGGAKRHVDSRWQQQVYRSCRNTLADRFPLAAGADTEVAIQDFIDFFKPGGIEAAFVQNTLSGLIDPQTFRNRQLDGQSLGLSSQALAMLQRGQQIRSAFFSSNNPGVSMQFSMKPERLDSTVRRFELDLGQSSLSYTHGPKIPRALEWHGGEDRRVRVLFEDLNDTVHRAQYEGDWALFRLLSAQRLTATSRGNVYQLDISAGGRSARYELSTRSSNNPFTPGLLNGYRCLQQL